MIIVGEKINSSRKAISRAVEQKDSTYIQNVATEQVNAGAHYIDVNAGTFLHQETEYLPWLVKTVQEVTDIPLCLDSPNPEALKKALEVHRGEAMINSISLEKDCYDNLLPVVTRHPCKVVALCMAEHAMPVSATDRIDAAAELIDRLTQNDVPMENIYVDPLVQPISVDVRMGTAVLEAIKEIMVRYPEVHTICGLSNISYGLPARRMINRQFLALAVSKGLSAAILDPTDQQLMSTLLTVRMLLGQDEYCSDFIEGYERQLFGRNA